MYPEELVLPMKRELTSNGFKELLNATDVDNAIKSSETLLIVINSVCGCSAGSARPGVLKAVQNSKKKPKHIMTSFAGFDIEAVNKIREHMLPFPPSSPSIALFKNGELVHLIERHRIEGYNADMVAQNLMSAFEQHC